MLQPPVIWRRKHLARSHRTDDLRGIVPRVVINIDRIAVRRGESDRPPNVIRCSGAVVVQPDEQHVAAVRVQPVRDRRPDKGSGSTIDGLSIYVGRDG